MSEKFPNAPLAEAVFELRVPEAVSWDEELAEDFLRAQIADLPVRDDVQHPMVEIQNAPNGTLSPVVRELIQKRSYSENRTQFVITQERQISVHIVRPYSTWEQFRPFILNTLSKLPAQVKLGRPERLGLRYVNNIFLDEKSPKLENYFEYGILLGQKLPQTLLGFSVQSIIEFQEGRDACRLLMNPCPSIQPEKSGFVLDIDYFLTKVGSLDFSNVKDWLDEAHGSIESIFLGSLTDKMKDIFRKSL